MLISRLLLTACLLSLSGLAWASQPKATVPCDRQLVMQIDSGRVSIKPDGIAVDAFGTSESAGWSNATLLVSSRSGGTATVDFVACRPEGSAQVLTPIQAQATLDLPPDTARIIIRTRTNAMTVDITRR